MKGLMVGCIYHYYASSRENVLEKIVTTTGVLGAIDRDFGFYDLENGKRMYHNFINVDYCNRITDEREDQEYYQPIVPTWATLQIEDGCVIAIAFDELETEDS